MEFAHEAVMLQEVIEALQIKPDGIYLDGTVGGGGHASAIAAKLQNGRLIGLDKDDAAVEAATKKLQPYGERAMVVREDFRNFENVLRNLHIDKADGIVLDLGVSSHQIDDPKRGFSYMHNDVLDMRMDRRGSLTAEEIVGEYTKDELQTILRTFGEERYAGKIAGAIVRERELAPIRTTGQLSKIICEAYPQGRIKSGSHPAKKTFQALRIAVNDELSAISDAAEHMIDSLQSKGRLCIITFHSLEDRIVKDAFRKAENPCTCPPDFPVCVCGAVPKGRVITRHPITATDAEIARNPRAKSAKLRVFEKG